MEERKCKNCKFFQPNPSDPNKGMCFGIPVKAEGSCPQFVPKS
ncbi:MAG: hypothetical protein ABDH25_03960 [Dictyoglomaceae bacterium]